MLKASPHESEVVQISGGVFVYGMGDYGEGVFTHITGECATLESGSQRERRRASGSSLVEDLCSFNTDCQRGMFCDGRTCQCLSDFVSIEMHCWPKINPGEFGCVNVRQCEAVWPDTSCSSAGVCECPLATVPSRTRDGTVCISSLIPPSCPLPEPHDETPNPGTVLANPSSHPLNSKNYMPILCTTTSTETQKSNGGDGSTWCVYPDGDRDIFIADIYDCIAHPQIKSELFPEYHASVDGICCPSRAFVCAQPMESGDDPHVPRWWFNAATGTCTQFMWDPNNVEGVSPNNFRTVEHCESYCRDSCNRGAIEFVHSTSAVYEETPRSGCLSSRSTCSQNNECVLIGSLQICCPTREYICSASGGRAYSTKQVTNFDQGVSIAGSGPTTRYYYDVDKGRCVSFVYYGLGNFNNFNTKQECEAFCSKLVCPNGTPLRLGEEWQRCETSLDCPSSHSCSSTHRVCCASSQFICTQPKRVGECTSSIRRYWYSTTSRQCEMFYYTGCQGNDNNFNSLILCQQTCKGVTEEPKCHHGHAYRNREGQFLHCSLKKKCPSNYVCSYDGANHGCCPTKAYTCSLGADRGVKCGNGRSFRYYFNVATQSCETFQYEGCDGNSNNFLSARDCQRYCGVGGCPNGAEPLKEGRSSRQVDCTTLDSCPPTHECVEVPVNGNVVHRCCPTKVYMCSQAPQPGSQCSTVSTTRYYFNLVTRQCESFQYNGCSGNHNNFANKEQCINFCASSGCDPGEIVLKEPGTLHPLYCTNNTRNSCPGTSQCRFNALVASSVCCGFKTANECPKDEQPYMNPLDESVRECAMNVPGTCPAHFLCRFNGKKNRYYCCAPSAENLCPEGRALYRSKKTSLPLRCFINSPNVCSNGFSCQSRTKEVTQGFCCSKKSVCRDDAKFLLDEKTKMPMICTSGSFSYCPMGYRCQMLKLHSSTGFCCKVSSVQRTERYQCCGGQSSVEEETMREEGYGCPPSQVAFLLNNEIVLCTSSENKCPLGYFCQFSAKNKRYQCCGQRSGCPGSSMAFLDLPGEAKRCLQGMKMCPTGYSCQMTKRGNFLCCSDMAVKDSFRINVTVTSDVSTLTKALPKQTSTVSAGPLQDRETQNYSRIVCEPNAHPINTECRLRGSVGAICFVNSQCYNDTKCVNSVCTHQDRTRHLHQEKRLNEQEKVNNTSIGTETIRGRCSENTQCNSETICRSRCRCVAGTIYYKNRCLANLCGAQWEPVTDTDHGVIECIGGVMCPRGSSCKFSTTISSYLCCRPNRTAAVNQSGLLTQPRVVGTRNEVTSKVSKWTEANVVPFAAATPDLRYYSPLSDWIFLCGPHVLSLCGARTISPRSILAPSEDR
ncbi:hypothetical protein RB195_010126 [Necator americanus]|uniref:BPTI/Kunitz inhibitor domain-containing protein n=1 Tax=Necator americanus TaxID=51031 RepID=A0ABR1CYY9_NECAM